MQPRYNSATNRTRLAALDRLAEAGDEQAEGEARRLRHWMQEQEQVDQKRQDDRMKVITGAAVLELLRTGRQVGLAGPQALLELLDEFLIRPSDREAVLGDGSGSEALRRVLGLSMPPNGLSGDSEAS
jgi:hypothetical protein